MARTLKKPHFDEMMTCYKQFIAFFLVLQATQEQIRLALLTNDAHSIDDSVFKQKVKQV
jgi:hypothetical protein